MKKIFWSIVILLVIASNTVAGVRFGGGYRASRLFEGLTTISADSGNFRIVVTDTLNATKTTTDSLIVNLYYKQIEIGLVDSSTVWIMTGSLDSLYINNGELGKALALIEDGGGLPTYRFSVDTSGYITTAGNIQFTGSGTSYLFLSGTADQSVGISSSSVYFNSRGNLTLSVDTNGDDATSGVYFTGNAANGAGDTTMTVLHSGLVGIGKTDPVDKFVILPSAGSGFVVRESDDGNNAIKGYAGTAGGTIDINTGGTPVFRFSATDTSYINNAKPFGIGTTNPQTELEISDGAVTRLDLVSDNDANNGDTDVAIRMFIDGPSGTGTQKANFTYDQGLDIVSINYGTLDGYDLNINNSGNIGIGTTTPAGVLHIQPDSSSSHTYMFMIEDTTGQAAGDIDTALVVMPDGKVGIGTTTPNYQLELRGAEPVISLVENDLGSNDYRLRIAAGKLVFTETGQGDRMVIDQNGNVGIGTTTPAHTLSIAKSDAEFLITDTAYNTQIDSEGEAEDTSAIYAEFSSGNPYLYLVDADGKSVSLANNLGFFDVDPHSSLGMRVWCASIGESLSESGLQLRNALAATAGINQNTPGLNLHGRVWDTGESASDHFDYLIQGIAVDGNPSSGYLGFYPSIDESAYSATPAMAIHTSGNVGFGTTTPAGILHIQPDSSASHTYMLMVEDTVGQAAGDIDTAFVVLANGNVGIGKTVPLQPLHVDGNIRTDENYLLGGVTILSKSGTNPNYSVTMAGSNSINDVRINTDGATAIFIDSVQHLGLGTLTPSEMLTIQPPTAGDVLTIMESDSGNATFQIAAYAANTIVKGLNNNSINAGFRFASADDGWYNGGNFGIGTADPDHPLHVVSGSNYQLCLTYTNLDDSLKIGSDASGNGEYLSSSGVHILYGRIRTGNGSEANAAYTFNSDNNTGMYRAGGDSLGFSTAGTNAILIDENQDSYFAGLATFAGANLTDNKNLLFGNGNDFSISYDEATDDRLEIKDSDSNLLAYVTDQGTTADWDINGDLDYSDNTYAITAFKDSAYVLDITNKDQWQHLTNDDSTLFESKVTPMQNASYDKDRIIVNKNGVYNVDYKVTVSTGNNKQFKTTIALNDTTTPCACNMFESLTDPLSVAAIGMVSITDAPDTLIPYIKNVDDVTDPTIYCGVLRINRISPL